MTLKEKVLAKAIEAKKDTISKLHDELKKLEKEQWLTEELPKLKKLIGTIWKYRNSYWRPTKPEDYFWTFIRIIEISEQSQYITAQEIQIDCHGKLSVDTRYRHAPSANWMRATKREWRNMIKRAETLLKKIGEPIS